MSPELALLAAVAALIAGVVTSLAVRPLVGLAAALRALGRGGAGVDRRPVPRLGGIAIFTGVGIACVAGLIVRWPEWSGVIPREELLALAVGTLLVFLVGAADDLSGASPWQKLLVELLAAWLVVRVGWSFHVLRLPLVGELDLGLFGGVVSLLWIVGVTNAVNLLDGLDGLAGGVAAIIAASLLAYSIFQDNQGTAMLFAAIVGACLGFLWHNWEPARVYMGDSGSLTLGFLFGSLTVHSSIKAPAAVAILVPILALGLPVIDTLLVMGLRFAEGGGRPLARRFARMFHADRSHVHHALERVVARRRHIVAVLYATALVFCAGALAVALTGAGGLGLLLLLVEIVVVLAMRALGLVGEARRLALARRAEARRGLPWWRDSSAEVELPKAVSRET